MVLHKKGKILLEETGTFEVPTLKKTTRVVKEVEEEFETVKLKKTPSVKPKDSEEEGKPQRVTKTTVLNIEEMVTKGEVIEMSVVTRRPAEEITPREKVEVVQKPEIFEFKELDRKEPEKGTWVRQKLSPKEARPDEKIALKKSPKEPKQEESESPTVALKKVQRLPLDDMKPEEVQLKPFKKPVVLQEPEIKKKEKPHRDVGPFEKGERIPREEAKVKEQQRKPEKAPPEEKEQEAKLPKPADKKKSPEKVLDEANEPTPIKKILKEEQEMESIKLKPFSVPSKVSEEPEKKPTEDKERKPADDKQLHLRAPDEKAKAQEPGLTQKRPAIPEALEKSPEKTTEVVTIPEEKVHGVAPSVKKSQKSPEEPKPLQLKKGVMSKVKNEKEEVVLKPVEQLKKVQLKKTPSPKVEKPIEAKPISVEKMPTLKKVAKMDSPQESAEAMKKVLKTSSPEKITQPEKLDKEKIPLVKEVSPEAVQMKKVDTQPEKEVFEEESGPEEKALPEEEEAWGSELVPQESYGSEDWENEGEDGALEVPGVTRRGEMDGGGTSSCCWVKTLKILHTHNNFYPSPPSCVHLRSLHHHIFSVM